MSGSLYGKVFIMPSISTLKKDIKRLRESLIQWVFEYDELIYKDCVHLEHEFYLRLGEDNLRLYQKHYKAWYLRRKLKLMQEHPQQNHSEIDAHLKVKFQRYLKKLEELAVKNQAALEWSYRQEMPLEQSRRLRKLYREIVIAVHPELHPFQTKSQQMMYQKAVSFYKKNDLPLMELLHSNLSEDYAQAKEHSFTELVDLRRHLLYASYHVKIKVACKRSEFPYSVRYNILVEQHCETMRQEIQLKITGLEAQIFGYQSQIEKLSN